MELSFEQAKAEDAERIYTLCRQLILEYERIENLDLEKVLCWVRRKIAGSIGEYTAVFTQGVKAGYFHFFKNEVGLYELDDLYIFPEFQHRGIGSEVIRRCCASVHEPVMLYVFIRNQKAVSLYRRFGFEIVKTIADSRYIMKRPCGKQE